MMDEIKELKKKIRHLEMMLALSPEIIECGNNRDWELVKKHGEPVSMPEHYEVIVLKK
ncbi:hypothetical protein [Companilactobacillus mishanensis]|uniref:hypothetical protein n=1 Tax=Companilactobacillus mishanensis TaxID=2486008 RepID=UPI00129539C1|nr:hypothetical protein [Companilactobacillus mishanensis]